ncbi:MAG: ABC transporter permease [Gorillibacterium sp.]|nr:ABC transporter permease [Gorillibacterium sp.]
MFLALREMRHAKARYMLIMIIMLLVSFLVLFITGLANGLAYANASSVENMTTGHFVLQKNSDQRFSRSQLHDADLQKVRSIVGETNATPLGVQMSTITEDGQSIKTDVTFFAIDLDGPLAPEIVEGEGITNETQNQVVVDRKLAESGIEVGSVIRDQATGKTWTVSGYTQNESFSHTPVVFINGKDWQNMKQATASDAEQTGSESPFNVIAVHATDQQVTQLTDKFDDIDVITQQSAIAGIPGYSAEQSSLLMMIVFLFIIAAFVLAVFFYVITVQKTSQFGVLKAIGAKTGYLARSVISQVLTLSLTSLIVSLLLIWVTYKVLPDSMPFRLEPPTIVLSCLLLVVVSVLGSLVSVLRVTKIDALDAIGRAA